MSQMDSSEALRSLDISYAGLLGENERLEAEIKRLRANIKILCNHVVNLQNEIDRQNAVCIHAASHIDNVVGNLETTNEFNHGDSWIVSTVIRLLNETAAELRQTPATAGEE